MAKYRWSVDDNGVRDTTTGAVYWVCDPCIACSRPRFVVFDDGDEGPVMLEYCECRGEAE